MRLVIARCSVDYDGRLTAHLPLATRLLVVKADGSAISSFTNVRTIEPGDAVIVPPKEEEKIRSWSTIRDIVTLSRLRRDQTVRQ